MSSSPCSQGSGARAPWPVLLLALILLTGCQALQRPAGPAAQAPPGSRTESLAAAKARLVSYHESGQYRRETEAVAGQVRDWLAQVLARTPAKPGEGRPAVVFGLDDVLLSNYARRKAMDFADPAVLGANLGLPPVLLNPPLPVLAPLLPVFTFARDQGLAVFVVSERPEIERAAVLENLTRAGYEGWTGIMLPPPGEETAPVASIKAKLREFLESRGFRIVANVGAKEADLAGGHAEKWFLLPDPGF